MNCSNLRSEIKSLILQYSERQADAIGYRSLYGIRWFGLGKTRDWHYQDAVQTECRRTIGKLNDLLQHEALSEDEKQEPTEQLSFITSAMKTVEDQIPDIRPRTDLPFPINQKLIHEIIRKAIIAQDLETQARDLELQARKIRDEIERLTFQQIKQRNNRYSEDAG